MSTTSGRLFVRVDDFPGTKSQEFYRHNITNFVKFHDVMTRYGLTYVLGVIPGYTTDEDMSVLVNLNGVEIALHGVFHDERYMNEFHSYMNVWDIQDMVSREKRRLEKFGCSVDTYIPPHNVIDAKTVNALVNTCFKKILGGPGTDDHIVEYAKDKVPIICSWPPYDYGRSDELLGQRSVEHIVDELETGKDVWLALHWTWELNIGLENLETYLTKLVSYAKERGIMVGYGSV